MKAYVLYGIDKYLVKRFICLLNAKNLRKAAERLNGTAEAVKLAAGSPLRHYFSARQECAVFDPGSGTFEDRARREGRYTTFILASFAGA